MSIKPMDYMLYCALKYDDASRECLWANYSPRPVCASASWGS